MISHNDDLPDAISIFQSRKEPGPIIELVKLYHSSEVMLGLLNEQENQLSRGESISEKILELQSDLISVIMKMEAQTLDDVLAKFSVWFVDNPEQAGHSELLVRYEKMGRSAYADLCDLVRKGEN